MLSYAELTFNSELTTRSFSVGLTPLIRTECQSHFWFRQERNVYLSFESTGFTNNPILLPLKLCHWTFSITMNHLFSGGEGREGEKGLKATVFYLGNIIQTSIPGGILFLLMGILVHKTVMINRIAAKIEGLYPLTKASKVQFYSQYLVHTNTRLSTRLHF